MWAVDWCDARAYCAWAGKRLCGRIDGGAVPAAVRSSALADEWYRACSAAGTRAFPYGDTYNPQACNGPARTGVNGRLPVASLATCMGGYPGLFDMGGNLQEWEDSCDDGGAAAACAVRGGSYASTNDLSCIQQGSWARDRGGQSDVGIRCCSD